MVASLLLFAGVLAATPGLQVPHPPNCTVPRHIVMCPGGDLVDTVIVRDFNAQPIPGAAVNLYFDPCLPLCAHPFPDGVTNLYLDAPNRRVIAVTDVSGRCVFRMNLTGTCAAANGNPISVQIVADGVPIGSNSTYSMSPDQNGDFVVDLIDDTILAVRVQTPFYPYTAESDLNADGVLDVADRTFLQAHLGHACDVATGARRSTWGDLKLMYR
jgi:hypothetical protein